MTFNAITTLNEIREHSPCRDGWEKLLAHLGKTKADDEPLELLTILESNGLDDALTIIDAAATLRTLLARAEKAEAERDEWKASAQRHHPNPVDFRYWEGRYRDERAERDALQAEADSLTRANRKMRAQLVEIATTEEEKRLAAWDVAWAAAWAAAVNAAWASQEKQMRKMIGGEL